MLLVRWLPKASVNLATIIDSIAENYCAGASKLQEYIEHATSQLPQHPYLFPRRPTRRRPRDRSATQLHDCVSRFTERDRNRVGSACRPKCQSFPLFDGRTYGSACRPVLGRRRRGNQRDVSDVAHALIMPFSTSYPLTWRRSGA